mgnify:CR=1 FL=1|tara:strand:+ start:163 stop:330 length:168 start_codon:yes stop_codon:yes gene_type:complete
MKKNLTRCTNCGEDNSILTQVSTEPDVTLLCGDCYNLKYANETQNIISYAEEEKS